MNRDTYFLRAGALTFGAFCCLALITQAQDWPQLTGPDLSGNMYVEAEGLPAQFSPGTFDPETGDVDLATARNVKWVARLGYMTVGNPMAANGRIMIGTRLDTTNSLLCLDEETGTLLWSLNDPRPGRVGNTFGWNSACAIYGDHIYTFSPHGELLNLTHTLQPSGSARARVLWQYDVKKELAVFPREPRFFSSGAPLVVGEFVYLNTMNGVQIGGSRSFVPAPNAPSLIAIRRQTGELAGKDDAGIGSRILFGSWSSPSTGRVNGRQLIFLGGGDGYCYAFDAQPVQEGNRSLLKTVWKADCNPPEYRMRDGKQLRYPRHDGPSEIIATPVFWRNRIYVSTGQDPEMGEGVGNLVCIDATQTGDITTSGILWRNKTIHRTRSTVSITPEGLLFLTDFSGFLHCLDAETGETNWTHDFKSNMDGNASTLVADGKLYFGDGDGDFMIFAAAKEKRLLWEVNMGAFISTTPVVANGVLFIATGAHLYAVAEGATAAR
jgi:outer membrane protein assembly factor BamB